MRARLIALSLLAAAGILPSAAANAEVFRCSDADGKTLYTDSACPAGMHAAVVGSIAQACVSEDCERRRESELAQANERVRVEKEQLAFYTADRRKREIEDRWVDEARYEAELRSMQSAPASPVEAVYPIYPAYPVAGISSKCGRHCLKSPGRRLTHQHASHPASRPAPEPRRNARSPMDR